MKTILISIIKFYKIVLSPLKGKATCRFYPTCSDYAIQAILKYGVLKGMILAVWRILRCNPFNDGGYDPLK